MFSKSLSPKLADLAEVAVCAYLADRFAPRRDPQHPNSASTRHRHIRVSLQLHQADLWRGTPQTALQELLRFLTGDEWKFDFEDAVVSAATSQEYLLDFMPPRKPRVMLFSGGLD